MRLELTLSISTHSEHVCKTIADAVEPDNAMAPPQIAMEMQCFGNTLFIRVNGENVSILTFRNTVDDLLEHISLVTKVIKSS
jgi:tRNA threonylcarbamoyladenosine modification (KEOPS) complex  Pcc1 subunit